MHRHPCKVKVERTLVKQSFRCIYDSDFVLFFGSEKYADVIYWSVVGKEKDIENIVKSIKRNNPKTMLNNKLPIRKSLKSVAWCVYLIQSIYYPMD